MTLGVVVGLSAEARLAAPLGRVEAGGGGPAGAAAAARRLIAGGATALLSFGLAGGLDPSLRPGTLVIPRRVRLPDGRSLATEAGLLGPLDPTSDTLLAGERILATVAEKRAAWEASGAAAIDLESGEVALAARAAGLGFAVLRAICDPAERSLPAAAMLALDSGGRVSLARVMGSLIAAPGQLPALLRLADDARRARASLLRASAQIIRHQA